MAYREDDGIGFLSRMGDSDLNNLVDVLIKDKDGSSRLTEELTRKDVYKKYSPRHSKYWEEIAAEIQCFGANSFATVFRGGKGVLYRETLEDVCDKSKVNFNKNQKITQIEDQLLIKLLGDALDKMSENDRKEFSKIIGITNLKSFSVESLLAIFQASFVSGGFFSYQLALIVANSVSRALLGSGLSFAGNMALTRSLAIISGPIGWAVTGIWTAVDVAGPAFRVTLPAVIHVALLRKKHQAEIDGLWEDIEKELS